LRVGPHLPIPSGGHQKADAQIFMTLCLTRVKDIDALFGPQEVRAVPSELCIKLGFCLAPIEVERMSTSPPRGIDEFTGAVFVAEGLDPVTSDRRLFNQVRDLVARAFVDHRSEQPLERASEVAETPDPLDTQ
jgi:hypothetical protein